MPPGIELTGQRSNRRRPADVQLRKLRIEDGAIVGAEEPVTAETEEA